MPTSLRSKLIIALSIPLAVLAFVGGLLAMGTWRAMAHVDRDHLQHDTLEAYIELALARNRYLIARVRQLGDDRAATAPDIARAAVQNAFVRASELVILDSDGAADMTERRAKLDAIEQAFTAVDAQLDALVRGDAEATRPVTLAQVADVLGSDAKRRLHELFNEAVSGERRAIAINLESEAFWHTVVFAGSMVIALCTFIISTILSWRATESIGSPVDKLLAATARVVRSDFSHPVQISEPTELSQLGNAVNSMAERMESSQRELVEVTQTKHSLESQVAARTRALERANAQLGAENRRRRQLLAELGHELRTPITVIRGEAEVTLRARHSNADEYRESLNRIIHQAEHTAQLVDDLLLLARGEASDLPIEREPVELAPLLRRLHTDVTALAAQRHQDLVLNVSSEGAMVLGDSQRLRQMVMILLDNACRYTPNGGRIELSLHADDSDELELCVRDDGDGIPADEMPHIFDHSFRGRAAQKRAPEGSGLGLPVAQLLAERHGGTLTIDSRPGQGTRVCLRLPNLPDEDVTT